MRRRPPPVAWHRRVMWYVYTALNVPPHTASTRSAYQICVGQRSDDHVQAEPAKSAAESLEGYQPLCCCLAARRSQGLVLWAGAEQDLCQPVVSAWRGDKQWTNQGGHAPSRGRTVSCSSALGRRGLSRWRHLPPSRQAWGQAPMPPYRRSGGGAHARASLTQAHEPRLDHVRRQDVLPRLNND